MRAPRGAAPTILRDRDFRLLWGGKLASNLGTRAAAVALPLLLVTVLHAGPATVGLATALEFLPWLMVLPAGALLDRVRVRGTLIACDIAGALLYASVPAAAWLGLLTSAQVLAVALLGGGAATVAETGGQAYLPRAFGTQDLDEANTLLQVGENAAALGGPALGGFLVQAAGAGLAFLANAGSFLASAASLSLIRRPEPAPRPSGASPAPSRIRADVEAGVRLVAGDPFLRPLTLWAATLNLGYAGWQVLLIPYLVTVEHLSPGTVGLLVAAGWAGAVLGALASRRAARRYGTARVFTACAFLTGPPILLVPLTGHGPRLAFYLAGTVVFYTGLGASNVITSAFRQQYPPPEMVARVTAAQWTLLNGVYPPGALLAGSLGAWLGIKAGLWVALGVMTASVGFALTPSLRRARDLPGRPDTFTATEKAAASDSPPGRG